MLSRPTPLNLVHYELYRADAQTADIALQHGDDFISRRIQHYTESDYSHSFMVGWCCPECDDSKNRVLMLAESTERRSQVSSLRWRIRECSGLVDIYRFKVNVRRNLDLNGAWARMLRFAGQDYPEGHIVRNLLAILRGEIRKPIPDNDDPEAPRTCSEALHWAFRLSGMLRQVQYDYLMFPAYGGANTAFHGWGDSPLLEYLCTPTRGEGTHHGK